MTDMIDRRQVTGKGPYLQAYPFTVPSLGGKKDYLELMTGNDNAVLKKYISFVSTMIYL